MPSETPRDHPTWTVLDARTFLAFLDGSGYKQAGYMVGLYGSTLIDGNGRDLDMLVTSWRPSTSEEWAGWFRVATKAELVDRHHSAWDRSMGTAWVLPDRRLVDCLFIDRAIAPPDAL